LDSLGEFLSVLSLDGNILEHEPKDFWACDQTLGYAMRCPSWATSLGIFFIPWFL